MVIKHYSRARETSDSYKDWSLCEVEGDATRDMDSAFGALSTAEGSSAWNVFAMSPTQSSKGLFGSRISAFKTLIFLPFRLLSPESTKRRNELRR